MIRGGKRKRWKEKKEAGRPEKRTKEKMETWEQQRPKARDRQHYRLRQQDTEMVVVEVMDIGTFIHPTLISGKAG